MARLLVTQPLITAAADALLAEGAEVTVVNLRSHIGGGSYTTIGRCLAEWRTLRATSDAAAPATPPEIETQGQDFIRKLWALASRQAQAEVQSVKAQADADATTLRSELAAATAEVIRLEHAESQHLALIEQLEDQLQAAQVLAAETGIEARRATESLLACGTELKAARQEATDKAVEVGKLMGEIETLRTQSRELIAAINVKSTKR
jgi:hypothetical protein